MIKAKSRNLSNWTLHDRADKLKSTKIEMTLRKLTKVDEND